MPTVNVIIQTVKERSKSFKVSQDELDMLEKHRVLPHIINKLLDEVRDIEDENIRFYWVGKVGNKKNITFVEWEE